MPQLTLNGVLAGSLLLAVTLVVLTGRGPHQGERPAAYPPTPAALAFAEAEAAAKAQEEAARRQAEAARAVAEQAEEETVLPEGHGRSETFGYCTACHNTALIRRSRFSRAQWDGLMDWMTERHGMNALEGELRETIVDYLANHFGAGAANPRSRNPFLN